MTPMTPSPAPTRACRLRTLQRGIAILSLGALIAGCGGGSGDGATPPAPAPTPAPAPAPADDGDGDDVEDVMPKAAPKPAAKKTARATPASKPAPEGESSSMLDDLDALLGKTDD